MLQLMNNGGAHFFSDAPVAVVLAVFESAMTLQKRLGHINGSNFTVMRSPMKRGQVCTKRTFENSEAYFQPVTQIITPKIVVFPLQLRKSG